MTRSTLRVINRSAARFTSQARNKMMSAFNGRPMISVTSAAPSLPVTS
jgi:hypothetical protein